MTKKFARLKVEVLEDRVLCDVAVGQEGIDAVNRSITEFVQANTSPGGSRDRKDYWKRMLTGWFAAKPQTQRTQVRSPTQTTARQLTVPFTRLPAVPPPPKKMKKSPLITVDGKQTTEVQVELLPEPEVEPYEDHEEDGDGPEDGEVVDF